MVSTQDVLAGRVAHVVESVRFEILDADGNKGAEMLCPYNTGTVTMDPANRITRSWSGVQLDPVEAAKVTPRVSRIRPVWVLSTGAEYPLGVFLYLGGSEEDRDGGTWVTCNPMPDRSHQLNQRITRTVNLTPATKLTDFLAALVAAAGITSTVIEPSSLVSGPVPLAWAAGETTRLAICDQITNLLGYLPVYFDSEGTLVARPVPSPADELPGAWGDPVDLTTKSHIYASGSVSRIIADTVKATTADAPNVYLVRSTAPSGVPVAVRYEIPSTEDNSIAAIGYEVSDPPHDLDGLADATAALDAAKALAARDLSVVRTVVFESTPDPRHDTWGVVEWEGVRMLELSWSLPLAGGTQSHTLKSVYVP